MRAQRAPANMSAEQAHGIKLRFASFEILTASHIGQAVLESVTSVMMASINT
jgi:hypothetical protein